MRSRNGTSVSGMFTDPIAIPARWSIREGIPKPTATTGRRALPHGGLEPVEEPLFGLDGRRVFAVDADRPVAPDEAGQDLRSADVDTDDVFNHERRLM